MRKHNLLSRPNLSNDLIVYRKHMVLMMNGSFTCIVSLGYAQNPSLVNLQVSLHGLDDVMQTVMGNLYIDE